MSHKTLLLTAALLALLNACSRDYTPDPKATGEEIYQAACAECHQADEQGAMFTIDPKNANPTYIAHKIRSGSVMMPKFPNISASDINKLSAFVLAHSKSE